MLDWLQATAACFSFSLLLSKNNRRTPYTIIHVLISFLYLSFLLPTFLFLKRKVGMSAVKSDNNISMELIFIRTILLFVVSVTLIRLMGKRQLGELEPYEVVITIMIAEVSMTPMDDPRVSILFGIIPIVTLYILHTLISYLSLKIIWFRTLMCGKETLIIDDGCLLIDNMRKNDYSMDELMEQLREKDIFNIDEISYAMIESGGTLSVLKKPEYAGVTRKDLDIQTTKAHLPVVIMTCGKFQSNCRFNKDKFLKIAKENGYDDENSIFYASLSSKNNLFIQDYGGRHTILDLGDDYAS